jgi:hypothetical protein
MGGDYRPADRKWLWLSAKCSVLELAAASWRAPPEIVDSEIVRQDRDRVERRQVGYRFLPLIS